MTTQQLTSEGDQTMTATITVPASEYADYDDCLAAAAARYVAKRPEAEGWDLRPRWVDDERGEIELTVPIVANAKIEERGAGFPDEGDYVTDGDSLYCVVATEETIHCAPGGRAHYIFALVEAADWADCPESDEHPAMVVLL